MSVIRLAFLRYKVNAMFNIGKVMLYFSCENDTNGRECAMYGLYRLQFQECVLIISTTYSPCPKAMDNIC